MADPRLQRIGFIGAGFIGRALGRLMVRNGIEVMLSNSRGPQTLASTSVSVGCRTGTTAEACAFGDVVVLALPFCEYSKLPAEQLAGKVVLDACNYYPHRDGQIARLDDGSATTSGLMAEHLPQSRVVKAFNAILERDIEADSRPAGATDRRALPIAGDDADAKALVASLHEVLGYDVVDAGPLAEGWRFQRARPAYCVRLDQAALRTALADTSPDVPDGSWRAPRSA